MTDNAGCLACGAPFPVGVRVDRKYCNRRCNNRHYKAMRRGAIKAPEMIDPRETLSSMTDLQVGWVAGIIEGEGSITVSRGRRYSGNTYTYPLICVAMTDEDVIRRLFRSTGVGRVSGPYLPPCRAKAGYKPQWQWNVNKMDAVEALAELLYPHLGVRRQRQVDIMRQKMSERTLLRA